MVFWKETMNHCACITSYKIYRRVWLRALFHFFKEQQTKTNGKCPSFPLLGRFMLLCLCRCFHLSGSGNHLSQRSVHSDGHDLWPRWDCGIPHSMGRDPRSALPPHVCHKRHLRSGHDYLQTLTPFLWRCLLILLFFFIRTDCSRRSGPDGWGPNTL